MQLETMIQRELLKGTISPIILQLLSQNGRMYGYEITQKVKELTQDKILLKEGSLYPALHKLEADGLITAEDVMTGKRLRRYYSLTSQGAQQSAVQVNELLDFLQTIYNLIIPENDPRHGLAF
jgi:DNA-binding PadR family transcriptional regulator